MSLSPNIGNSRETKDPKAMANDKRKVTGKTLRSLAEKWMDASEGSKQGVAQTLKRLAPDIMESARDLLQKDGGSEVDQDIRRFLEGAQAEHKIDDCVRWHILLRAVELDDDVRKSPTSVRAQVALTRIIVVISPKLAFENPHDEGDQDAENDYEKRCVHQAMHQQYKEKRIPFHVAARCGNYEAIGIMIEGARKVYDASCVGKSPSPLLKVLREPDPASGSDETALELAAKAGLKSRETLAVLLKVDGIATIPEPDKSFQRALDDGLDEVVDQLLTKEQLVNSFVTSDCIEGAMKKMDEPIKAQGSRKRTLAPKDARKRRGKIVRSLVRQTNKATFTIDVAKAIIQRDSWDIWEAKPDNVLTEGLQSCLLHLAVFYQKEKFVKSFVDDYPISVSQERAISAVGSAIASDVPKFPLWYNNHHQDVTKDEGKRDSEGHSEESAKVKSAIRDLIVDKMIREVHDMEKLSDIFQKSDGEFNGGCRSPYLLLPYVRILTLPRTM
jgi:hypothetical protein